MDELDVIVAENENCISKPINKNNGIVKHFEKYFSNYIETKYAIGTSMGRTALFAVLKSLGMKDGDEVIVPAYTCEVVPYAVIKTGAKPVFVDINQDDCNISISHLKTLISNKTRAIIISHTLGYLEDVDLIKSIISKHNEKIYLIEDAAHALGAEYKGKKVGSLGDVAIFSFTKNITNIGGGAITTNDNIIAKRIAGIVNSSREISLVYKLFFGANSFLDRWKVNSVIINMIMRIIELLPKKVCVAKKSYTESMKIPECYSMSKIQAWLALHQMRYVNTSNKKRSQMKSIIDQYLKDCRQLIILENKFEKSMPVYTWYVIRSKVWNLNELRQYCAVRKIFLTNFWKPLPREVYGSKNEIQITPNAIGHTKSVLVFKLNHKINEKKIVKIASTIKDYSNRQDPEILYQ